MSTCTKELVKGFITTNPTTTRTLQADIAAETESYRVITVFNESDKPALIDYKNTNADVASFYVPPDGRSFTRVINGDLLKGSLYVTAVGGTATGNLYFNLGN